MKKSLIRCVSIVGCLILMLCSCSKSTSLTVTFSDGSTKTMTAAEVISLSENDGRKFSEIELIEGKGKVTNVGLPKESNWSDAAQRHPTGWSMEIEIENDVTLYTHIDSLSDAPDYYNGDILEFAGSCIGAGWQGKVQISYLDDHDSHYLNLK